jgi:hypothetical protein
MRLSTMIYSDKPFTSTSTCTWAAFKAFQNKRGIMYRGYTCLYRKIWSNAVLAEPGKRFSRLEAWLYITNVLATGKDDEAAGLKRGEFVASIRQLGECFNWSVGSVHRFLETLSQNSMIMRVEHSAEHLVEQETGHFSICNYETYNSPRYTERNTLRNAERNTFKEVLKESINKTKNTHVPAFAEASAFAKASADASPKILVEIYQQNNQSLPEVKALTSERLKKCRLRINQAVRDGCLEQYLADFLAAVKKAQQTPFLRGEGARGWRAGFDWFIANNLNIYAVLEGKYDGPAAGPNKGGANDNESFYGGGSRPSDVQRREFAQRTSHGEPTYIPRQ